LYKATEKRDGWITL